LINLLNGLDRTLTKVFEVSKVNMEAFKNEAKEVWVMSMVHHQGWFTSAPLT
jgi:hypothetical protein